MYLLDTNVLSELRPGKPHAEPVVIEWAKSVPITQIYVSAITVLEIELGILRLERRRPPQGSALRVWFDAATASLTGRILPLTLEIAKRCATLHIPNPMPERDAMIAATAMVHGMTLVTRNVGDFKRRGLSVLNPWE